MTDSATTSAEIAYAPLKQSVRETCARLQSAYLGSSDRPANGAARATLANLRKFAGSDLGKSPLALEQVLLTLEPRLAPEALGKSDAPSASEYAAFATLVYFAIHMQSATAPMHDPKVSFARACGRLYALELSGSIKPRVDAMLLATDESARLVHLRSLISLLRANGIAFDYGRFAEDLRGLRNPAKRNGIQLRWGRDFVYGSFQKSAAETTTSSSNFPERN